MCLGRGLQVQDPTKVYCAPVRPARSGFRELGQDEKD